jgi:hypothetical protein
VLPNAIKVSHPDCKKCPWWFENDSLTGLYPQRLEAGEHDISIRKLFIKLGNCEDLWFGVGSGLWIQRDEEIVLWDPFVSISRNDKKGRIWSICGYLVDWNPHIWITGRKNTL